MTETLQAATTTEGTPAPQSTEASSAPVSNQQQAAPAETVKAAPVPEKQAEPVKTEPAYEIKGPEGFDPEALKTYACLAKDLKLDHGAAQTMLDKLVPVLQERQAASIAAIQAEWDAAVTSDAEIGGPAKDSSAALVAKAVEQFATPALKELLGSGLDRHPEIRRLFARIGKAITPDAKVVSGTLGAERPALTPTERLMAFYDKGVKN